MQDIAPAESQPGLLARDVRIVLRFIVEVRLHAYFALPLVQLSVWRNQLEGDRSFRVLLWISKWSWVRLEFEESNDVSYQYRQDIAWRFTLDVDIVNFDHLVAHVDQSGPVGSSTVHNSGDDDFTRFLVGFDCGTLQVRKM